MTAYTDHGKTSSAERNCGRQPKLGARDRCILKWVVSKHYRTAAAKVTAELNIHLEDADSTKTVRRELHKSNIHDTVATAKPLIIENNTRTRNRWCDNHKTGRMMTGNTYYGQIIALHLVRGIRPNAQRSL
jgi:hypothetical protein